MRQATVALLYLMFYAATSAASPSSDFTRQFAMQSPLQRAAGAYQICNTLFAASPTDYVANVQEIGRLWTQASDAAYYLISTCQTMWLSRYLDPVKASQIQKANNGATAAFKLAQLDLIGSAKALGAEIRLYNQVRPSLVEGTKPAPYEILSGLASSERELSETLNIQTKLAISSLVTATGVGAQVLLTARDLALTTRASSAAATGMGAEPALALFLLSWAATDLAENGYWFYRERDLWSQVFTLKQRLAARDAAQPLPVLLDEFYRATERLGYFYSYELYLAESGRGGSPEGTSKCMALLNDHYSGVKIYDLSRGFDRGKVCEDAATLWLAASQWLNRQYPNDATASQIAERLLARSKRTYWSYLETAKFKKSIGDCGTLWNWIGCAH